MSLSQALGLAAPIFFNFWVRQDKAEHGKRGGRGEYDDQTHLRSPVSVAWALKINAGRFNLLFRKLVNPSSRAWAAIRQPIRAIGPMRLREHLMDILEDPQNGEAWFAALAREVPAEAIGRFLDGGALTSEQSKAVVKFTSEFGYDMRTHKLVRRRNVAS